VVRVSKCDKIFRMALCSLNSGKTLLIHAGWLRLGPGFIRRSVRPSVRSTANTSIIHPRHVGRGSTPGIVPGGCREARPHGILLM
jgi:hypothetical protein